MLATSPVELDLQLPSVRLHAQRFGSAAAPLVLCLPGLTANMKSFDFIGERLGSETLQLVALDLRGRGESDVLPAGSYGLERHAQDVFAAADALGVDRFGVIGHSMGAGIALTAAASETGAEPRIARMVLIDLCGIPEASTKVLIDAAVARLGSVFPSVEAYLELVKQIGTVSPWSDYFERYLRYELEPAEGGVRARTSKVAALEDGAVFAHGRIDPEALWRSIRQPTLLLRAARELVPGAGHIIGEAERDAFARTVPSARVAEIDANHYGIITADSSVAAIAEFFGSTPASNASQ